MSWKAPGTTMNFVAEGAIAHRRIAKMGAADYGVLQATATTEAFVGVVDAPGGVAAGDRVDVTMDGIAEVELGGTVTRGNPITADSAGKGVAASPAATVNAQIIGFAVISGVAGDYIPVHLGRGTIQGAGAGG